MTQCEAYTGATRRAREERNLNLFFCFFVFVFGGTFDLFECLIAQSIKTILYVWMFEFNVSLLCRPIYASFSVCVCVCVCVWLLIIREYTEVV